MPEKQVCQWLSEDPPKWKIVKNILRVLTILTSILSIYTVLQRSYSDLSGEPDLPQLLCLKVPVFFELAVYVVLGVVILLRFQGWAIRLFIYHSLRQMCPLSTPTLSDRIHYAMYGSSWVQKKTRVLHHHVKNLELENGLTFTKNDLEDFIQLVGLIAETLKTKKLAKNVIAITPLNLKSIRHELSMNFWDLFLQECGVSKSSLRCYYLIDNDTLYSQKNYTPGMERISSCFSIASRYGKVRVIYRDDPAVGSVGGRDDQDALEIIDKFVEGKHSHYLAVQQNDDKWIFIKLSLGAFNTGFYEGKIFEHLDIANDTENTKELISVIDFDRVAIMRYPLWRMSGTEKASRHISNFDKLQVADHAWFIDWAFMLNGWNDDFMQQIREATVHAIGSGFDVRRIFVVGDKESLDAAYSEALRQVPMNERDEHIDRHMGYILCPEMTRKWWKSIIQANEASIAREAADFALYSFESGDRLLYVNNFDGAPQVTSVKMIETASRRFENVWSNCRKFK